MPLIDFQKLQNTIDFADATPLMRTYRDVKSTKEIAKSRFICQLALDSFEAFPKTLKAGQSERDNCLRMKIDMLERGADAVPYLIAGSGPNGYERIIKRPVE
jgi:Xaa-Pro aminopeptidase